MGMVILRGRDGLGKGAPPVCESPGSPAFSGALQPGIALAHSTPPFPRLVLEGVVIVLSILAALALDAGWDEWQEDREAARALESLDAEFVQARESIEFYRSIEERILHAVSSVVDSLDAAQRRGSTSVVLPDTALGLAYIPPTTSVRLGTLEGLIASGRLDIIEDPELRTALALWGSTLDELVEEEVTLRQLAYGEMDRELREEMNTNGLWEAGNIVTLDLPEDVLRATRSVPASTEILGVFHLRRSVLTHAMDEFEELIDEVDHIMTLIEAAR